MTTGGPTNPASLDGWVLGRCPVLVERSAQLELLDRVAQRVATGESHLVVLTGEAGAGKSRLASEFTATLGPDWRTLSVRIEAGSTSPLGVVIGAVPAGDVPAGAIGSALALALADRAPDGPLAMVIEDLERADPVVIAALAATLDGLQAEPVLLLAAFRLGEGSQPRDGRSALARVLRHGRAHEVRLESLSREGVADMARAMGREVSETGLDELLARGGGNPFFVEELLQSPSDRLPWTLTEAVLERLEVLPDAARQVAEALACAKDAVARDVVEEVVPEAAAGTMVLLDAGIVLPSGDDISLRHALTAEIVDTHMSAKSRRDWHRRLAAALEQRGDTPAARLTRHWRSAGDDERAAHWAVVAADEAMDGRAYRTAADFFRVALARPPVEPLEQAELFDRAAVAAGWVGLQREALEWATAADAGYRDAGEQWRAVALWLNPALSRLPKPAVDHRELAEDAIPRLLVEASELTKQRAFDGAAGVARRVIDLSDESSDEGATSAADAARRLISAGKVAEGEDILHRLRAVASASQNPSLLARVLAHLATLAAARGELVDSLMFDRQAISTARSTDLGAWPYEAGTALVLARMGELDEAAAIVDTLLASDNPLVVEFAQLPACLVDLERGDLEDAWARLERLQVVYSLGIADFIVGVLAARGRWYVLTGRHQEALEDMTHAEGVTGDLFEPTRIDVLVVTVRAAAALGGDARLARAGNALDEVVELGGGRGFRAAGAWAHGLERARAGALDDAQSLLASGAEQFEGAHRFAYAGEAWVDVARIAEQRGDIAARDAARARAIEIARSRGLRSVLARVEAELDARPVGSSTAAPPGPLQSLSQREHEIARLVVEGKTNREIAAVLFLSEHTVRNQLVKIFGKLGIARRAELARLAAGLEPSPGDSTN